MEIVMTDRPSASIELGGTLSAMDYLKLTEIIASEDLSIEWDGEPFDPDHRIKGESLSLYAHEVSDGQFKELEPWCVTMGLPFARWSSAYSGHWGAERVFTGSGNPQYYAADEEEKVVIDRALIEQLGTFEAIIAHFDAADFTVPPLVIEHDPVATAA
jgi:hypothetical protein